MRLLIILAVAFAWAAMAHSPPAALMSGNDLRQLWTACAR
jgi:hypothetical protein